MLEVTVSVFPGHHARLCVQLDKANKEYVCMKVLAENQKGKKKSYSIICDYWRTEYVSRLCSRFSIAVFGQRFIFLRAQTRMDLHSDIDESRSVFLPLHSSAFFAFQMRRGYVWIKK